jgi:hypothetical protein
MNTEIKDDAGFLLGYYFYDTLSSCYIAVRTSDGERRSAQHAFQCEHFIREVDQQRGLEGS